MFATRIFTRVVLMGLPAAARAGRVPVPAVGATDGNGSGTRERRQRLTSTRHPHHAGSEPDPAGGRRVRTSYPVGITQGASQRPIASAAESEPQVAAMRYDLQENGTHGKSVHSS